MIDPRRLLGFLGGALVSESAMVALMQAMALALCAVALMMALDELREAQVLDRWFGRASLPPPPSPLPLLNFRDFKEKFTGKDEKKDDD